MRVPLAPVLAHVLCATLVEAGGPSKSAKPADPPKNLEVVWSAPTNGWPERLWIYKTLPQEFPEAVLSNLLWLASFTAKDRAKPPSYLLEHDKKTVFYGNIEGTAKHLAICPNLGYIEYHDPRAESSSHLTPVIGVPSQEETTALGMQLLRLLGIDISQMAMKAGSTDLDLHWERGTIAYTDQNTSKEIVLTNNFGVFFRRRIDGVNTSGIGLRGGARFTFGNNAKLADLQVCWRNLKPHALIECASPREILSWLESGKIPIPTGKTSGPALKMLISQALPYYDTKLGEEREDFILPKIDLVATVESEASSATTIIIKSPILRPQSTKQ